MTKMYYKALRQNQTNIFPWYCSAVTATFDCSILWICSDRQLYTLGTKRRTVRQCVGLHISAATQIYRAALHWHSAGNVWKVGHSALIFLLLAQCLQTGVEPYNLIRPLEIINHNIWQQLHKRKRDELRENINYEIN
jgi:hypothetical protein